MIIVKCDAMLDNYKALELSKTIKEMAETGVIVIGKGMELIEKDIKHDEVVLADAFNEADKKRKILETPEGNTPPGFK